MNIQVLAKYNITLEYDFFYKNLMKSPHLILNQFAIDADTQYEINEIISIIESVLRGEKLRKEYVTNSLVTAAVFQSVTNFYADPEFDEKTPILFSIPTIDFRDIMLSWKEHLQVS